MANALLINKGHRVNQICLHGHSGCYKRRTKDVQKTYKRRTKDVQKTYKRRTKDVQKTYKRRTKDVQKTYKRSTKDVQKTYKRRTKNVQKTYKRRTKDVQKTYKRRTKDVQKTYINRTAYGMIDMTINNENHRIKYRSLYYIRDSNIKYTTTPISCTHSPIVITEQTHTESDIADA